MLTRGPYKGRRVLYEKAREFRRAGIGCRSIAARIGIGWRTVFDWVKDIQIDATAAHKRAIAERTSTTTVALKQRASVRKCLIRTRGYRCERCGISEWMGQKIPLEVEHINGVHDDNRDENVLLLCPNCHSITPTWKGRNGHRRKISGL